MLKVVFFRVDANSSIGLGHLTRSLALADMLTDFFNCTFLVQNPATELVSQISTNHSLVCLPETTDYLAEAQQLSQNYLSADSIAVLDGYEFRTDYQRIIKESGCKLVCIDDLHAWHFVADAVINHTGGIEVQDYSCEYYTQLYLGPEYALLRPSFLEMAREPMALRSPGTFTTMIAMGGADPNNYTLEILKEVSPNSRNGFAVVLGSAYQHSETLNEYISHSDATVEVFRNLSAQAMAALMKRCQTAIIPPSGISYEYLCTGGSIYLKKIAENQARMFNYLINDGFASSSENYGQLVNENRTTTKLIDGKSPERITRLFVGLEKSNGITMRKATQADKQIYFDWVNNPVVRENSVNSAEIEYKAHSTWFDNRLNAINSILYYFECKNVPMAQVRFENLDGKIDIDYSVDEAFRGMGFGKVVLMMAIQGLLNEAIGWRRFPLNAQVKTGNVPSAKIFRSLQFEELTPKVIGDETYLGFYKEQ